MGKNRYPRKDPANSAYKSNKPCALCNEAEGVRTYTVQVDWFRSNDETFPVCQACWKLPETELCEKLIATSEVK